MWISLKGTRWRPGGGTLTPRGAGERDFAIYGIVIESDSSAGQAGRGLFIRSLFSSQESRSPAG